MHVYETLKTMKHVHDRDIVSILLQIFDL